MFSLKRCPTDDLFRFTIEFQNAAAQTFLPAILAAPRKLRIPGFAKSLAGQPYVVLRHALQKFFGERSQVLPEYDGTFLHTTKKHRAAGASFGQFTAGLDSWTGAVRAKYKLTARSILGRLIRTPRPSYSLMAFTSL